MTLIPKRLNLYIQALALATGTLLISPAIAGISYKLDRPQATAGETVNITGLLFNDTDTAITWRAPRQLVVQWRDQDGKAIRSLAYLSKGGEQANVPVNNFVKFAWSAVVPTGVRGLQAVNIEGDTTLLALDTSPLANSTISGTPATGTVVDAGAATGLQQSDPALPENVVVAAGASISQGPAVTSTQQLSTPPSGFARFSSAISAYEPIYFDVGNKGGRNARYQVSFKYRLFTPDDPNDPKFADHFYLGYTQTALWDLHSDSNPFVDTSFKPSLFWQKDALWQSPSKDIYLGLASGIQHESNGKSEDDSRSINYAYIQPEFNYRFDGGSTLTFAPRVKSYFAVGDKNSDYTDYAGHVDWKLRWAQDNGLVLSGLYRQGHEGRSTSQIEAAWPLKRTFLNMNGYLHVQYFKGYGETLLGYNYKSEPQVRVGISLVP